jgi:putative PIN family toxin of toxin-antitoxin system
VIVVVDSGVWISALHFGGTPLAALDHVFLSDQLAVCDQIVMEIRAVLIRKFLWEDEEIREVLDEYLSGALNIRVDGTLQGVCRDPKDDMVLECAVNAEAQLVVTGDNDLLAVEFFGNIRIVTARTYLADAPSQLQS